jgi:hypothetical protein
MAISYLHVGSGKLLVRLEQCYQGVWLEEQLMSAFHPKQTLAYTCKVGFRLLFQASQFTATLFLTFYSSDALPFEGHSVSTSQ